MGIVVAIDGPSGAGKSSTSKAIAIRAGWNYLDTGALYRAVTWVALENNCVEATDILKALKSAPIRFVSDPTAPDVFAGDTQITHAIRGTSVTENVSRISAMPSIREELLSIQRKVISQAPRGIVVEGRDIGTVVVPDAALKIFLTADLDARAFRREGEIDDKSVDVKTSLENRDSIDTNRTVSPLAMAFDAVEVDSTNLDLDETVERIWELLRQRSLLGLPIVAILGRPNVGKSTLINRFLGRREAIVEDTPGVTRDRIQYECEWGGRRFIIMDTGGWEAKPDGISVQVSAGAEIAMQEADVLAFVVDAQVGALDEDDILVQHLRKAKKPLILIGNKVDGEREESEAHGLWSLGLGEPYFVSALHGRGSGDLLDHIVAELPEVGGAQTQDGYRKVALIGRPNVGKSSLLNALAGENRSIVDDVAGTTRDPVDELIEFGGSIWRFIDTAGLKKRANQASGTDYYASLRTQTALERCEVAVVVLDASEPITEQDLRVITMVEEAGKAMVIVMNKWDLVDEDRRDQLDREIDRHLDQVEWAQRVNVAAKTGWHRDRLAPALRTALDSWEKRVPTAKLNSFLGALIGATPPPVRGGKQPKVYYATQAGIAPPKFVVFSNGWIEASYRRFIERRLREEFSFPGTPVQVAIRVKERE
ncbi:MAG: ribosome biogenesis GTPase Der [Actinobacteria bacterium]|uniref:GTPase Der n=2 Tax=root TaxID=1 RepID=A0A6J6ZKY3_9ZZZZ|nr:ribosome biogenesis GTPase Der [Actinomycetota bacterium]MSX71712.1 ribosome biogenesis GTPase Der [Actinomycetota bacterium]MSY69286.1 ribosome biogenesis GTPase Der [Actinomycetota bacterium]MTA75627.1 ribosome biogenesis GTPase Der [Actinomycetota bacterium]